MAVGGPLEATIQRICSTPPFESYAASLVGKANPIGQFSSDRYISHQSHQQLMMQQICSGCGCSVVASNLYNGQPFCESHYTAKLEEELYLQFELWISGDDPPKRFRYLLGRLSGEGVQNLQWKGIGHQRAIRSGNVYAYRAILQVFCTPLHCGRRLCGRRIPRTKHPP